MRKEFLNFFVWRLPILHTSFDGFGPFSRSQECLKLQWFFLGGGGERVRLWLMMTGWWWCVKVLELAASIYKQIPENIDYDTTAQVLSVDPCPLNVVLLQEVCCSTSVSLRNHSRLWALVVLTGMKKYKYIKISVRLSRCDENCKHCIFFRHYKYSKGQTIPDSST